MFLSHRGLNCVHNLSYSVMCLDDDIQGSKHQIRIKDATARNSTITWKKNKIKLLPRWFLMEKFQSLSLKMEASLQDWSVLNDHAYLYDPDYFRSFVGKNILKEIDILYVLYIPWYEQEAFHVKGWSMYIFMHLATEDSLDLASFFAGAGCKSKSAWRGEDNHTYTFPQLLYVRPQTCWQRSMWLKNPIATIEIQIKGDIAHVELPIGS